MGKSPAKWFRSVLLGKKGAKSGISKKSAKNKGPLVSSKETASNLSMDLLSLVPETLPASAIQFKEDSNSEKGEAEKLVSYEVVNTSMKQNDNAGSASESTVGLPGDLQKHRLEQAATKAQAAFRGYLARQAFQKLKGVIKLQAAIRGHLVRRQAVATLYCLRGVVKIQALARGQIVRRSKVENEMLQKQVLGNQTPGYSKTNASVPAEELLKNAFTNKLLRSSPSSMPLQLQYGPGEPNSSHEWLMRWTIAKIWIPESQPKDTSGSNKKPKIRKGSNNLILDTGKDKNSPKKMPHHHSAKSVSEHQGNEIEKIRLNLKKISKPIMEKSARSEPNTDRSTENNLRKQSSTDNNSCHELEKPSGAETLFLEGVSTVTAPSVPADLNSLQSQTSTNCSTNEPAKHDDAEKLPEKLSNLALVTELNDTPVSKISPNPIAQTSHEDISTTPDEVLNCNGKKNENGSSKNKQKRRASLPLKYDMDGGHGGTPPTQRKLPSYMAPTQSARAKVREQASPRYGQEALESIAVTRRYSMPSLTTGKMSSSPRVQKLVAQASGKEGIKIDRSLSTSRDGSDKAIRAEWKR
ncbi:unnamed protein product [Cuscuta campestris]|uniref:DUF4005 domain-containing protein n=1 Tax=Cuscuta campestris TaxID=132261 RepID=A0A484KQ01_9ASTE|nr:unnamed protein product [Cuscuta campestris]